MTPELSEKTTQRFKRTRQILHVTRRVGEIVVPASLVGLVGVVALPTIDTYPDIANFIIGFYWGLIGEFGVDMFMRDREKGNRVLVTKLFRRRGNKKI